MENKNSQKETSLNQLEKSQPNEISGVIFSSGIKIIDPETQEVLLHVRDE